MGWILVTVKLKAERLLKFYAAQGLTELTLNAIYLYTKYYGALIND